ncbi:hypothetical protein EYM_02780 [Ignicoccus islandicus DSM 13165]|uniref:THUMP domain-containing protein n=1 Tax=Ignicoccus islandicus DSM 13165 TaxID=940295 RepID=A0A0U3FR68_9CREN|nr:THUMP domain-containing protein [Ignicoccus islandicus]ALU12359.1 hypothetical protein EYM_02780 [Ignicoccus islandicus DSM 13165]
MKVTLVAYSEIALKGKKRGQMESLLRNQVAKFLHRRGFRAKVELEYGRILVRGEAPKDLRRMPGVHHLIYALVLPKLPPTELVEEVSSLYPKLDQFAVRVRRADKAYPMKSNELAALIGSKIEGNVNLSSPKVTLYVEIRNEVYVYTSRDVVEGVGGLPYGSEGTAYVDVTGEEGLLAAALMARRGVEVVLREPMDGVEELARALPKPLVISRDKFEPIVGVSKGTIIVTRPCVLRKTLEKVRLLLNRHVSWRICGV